MEEFCRQGEGQESDGKVLLLKSKETTQYCIISYMYLQKFASEKKALEQWWRSTLDQAVVSARETERSKVRRAQSRPGTAVAAIVLAYGLRERVETSHHCSLLFIPVCLKNRNMKCLV